MGAAPAAGSHTEAATAPSRSGSRSYPFESLTALPFGFRVLTREPARSGVCDTSRVVGAGGRRRMTRTRQTGQVVAAATGPSAPGEREKDFALWDEIMGYIE